MKKLVTTVIVVCLIIFFVALVYAIANTAQQSNGTIDWVATVGVLVVALAVILTRFFTVRNEVKKLMSAYNNKDYTTVVELKNTADITGLNKIQKQTICLTVAISYLELENQDEFFNYIQRVDCPELQNLKLFWQAVSRFSLNDMEGFGNWKHALENSNNEKDKQKLLSVMNVLEKSYQKQPLNDEDRQLTQSLSSVLVRKLIETSVND